MRIATLLPALLALLISPVVPAGAQQARPLVVMNLAAHPDDEDGRTLAYYRHAKDAMAYSVIFTRGEGGQNEIGPELYEELGALRTEETERAARVLGTQVFFLNFKDFGFSKHAAETFETWGGQDHVMARLVYLVRKLKPDVLFTNHDTVTVGPQRQHGHHQAVGISAYQAMSLAADPTYHPEHLEEPGVDLWQPKRLFLRHWSKPDAHDVAVPVGEEDEALGQSYAALAVEALRKHASQGMGLFAGRMQSSATYFSLLTSATDAPLDPHDFAGSLPPNTEATPDLSYWIDSGRAPALPETTLALDTETAVPGQAVRLRWQVDQLPQRRLRWEFSGAIDTTLYLSDQTPGVANLTVSPKAIPSLPKAVQQYERFRNHPPAVFALYGAGTDSLLAAGYLPLEVAPPLVLDPAADVMRLHSGRNALVLHSTLYDQAAQTIPLTLAVASDSSRQVLTQEQHTLTFDQTGARTDTLVVALPDSLPSGTYTIRLTALPDRATTDPLPVHAQTTGRVFSVDVPAALKVGVIQSYDDALAVALSEMGVDYTLLDSLDLAHGRFDDLHTIVIDIRAYLVRQDLRMYNEQLLDWVHGGGHLVVNYQKTFEWNPGSPDPFDPSNEHTGSFAPYPLELGRDRVTREEAPVTLLQPDHVLFHASNTITASDWEGWVQERGLYFPRTYDERYIELFSTHDPGEPPLRGSTLLTHAGDGTYLYTALVWYRQLKIFHPGAYKLFANMLSLPLMHDYDVSVSTP